MSFHEASELTPDHIHHVESTLRTRVLRYFRRHGLLDDVDAAGMLTWQGSGGFSVDASVRIEAEDRTGIERLVRYCARPPFALERLHALDSTPALAAAESRLLYRFPKPDVHGRTELLLTPLELLDAIATTLRAVPSSRHRASIVTATTCWLPMPGCGPTSSHSVGHGLSNQSPNKRLPPRSAHPWTPPRLPPPLPASDGLCCSRGSTTCSRSCVPPAAAT